MAAGYLALKNLPIKENSHVAVHSDNSTVVNCLNRRGSARSRPLNAWVLSIFILAERKKIVISAFHIQGVKNVIADALSRTAPISTEWQLDKDSFSQIVHHWGQPEVDLFATKENHQVQQYVSPVPDPEAVGLDAFTVDWDRWSVVYMFPPPTMIQNSFRCWTASAVRLFS